MKRTLTNILVTGGAGFIGANFIHFLFNKTDFQGRIINLDALTYAGNLESLKDIDLKFGINTLGKTKAKYIFEYADITDKDAVNRIFKEYSIDTVVHFAAESHVDRSILGPEAFIKTNIIGTFNLLETARNFWKTSDSSIRQDVLFHHVSTDEVYGSLGETGYFEETTPYDPRSPYSSSKASSDHLVCSYSHTYELPITLSNCSNNYGPFQFPEKLIPLMILNILGGKPLPIYGDGKNVRDWLYVEDHNNAVWTIMNKGKIGEKYNIGGENEWQNIKLLEKLIDFVAKEINKDSAEIKKTIKWVQDRPGHDRRYAINCNKLKNELGWSQKYTFEEGLLATVKWYLSNPNWVANVQSGEYANWIKNNYENR
ncbi:MAG: dTDP-glucose 4,6-dehydratase [Treponema sp.]|jgi:dTDP-glucose 4,6-dehydratase|nr:dTDP-glucose 4,6-dehydratase [Treponema sp.]